MFGNFWLFENTNHFEKLSQIAHYFFTVFSFVFSIRRRRVHTMQPRICRFASAWSAGRDESLHRREKQDKYDDLLSTTFNMGARKK